MKKTDKKGNGVFLFGYKISSNTLAIIIIAVICAVVLFIGNRYRNYLLNSENTEVVSAKIIDVGTHYRGGTRLRYEGYIKFQYYINGKDIINSYSSISIRDKINQYHIGDCIELKVSLENEHIYEWNEEKGAFDCN
jgi:hypothetical protein